MNAIGNRQKTKYIGFKLTEKEYERVMRKIDRSGLSISKFMLRCCENKKIVQVDGFKDFKRQITGIGSNLNRMATLCNMGRITAVNLDEARAELMDIKRILTSIDKQIKVG